MNSVLSTQDSATIQSETSEGFSPDPRLLCWCKHKYADHAAGTFCKKKGCGCNSFSQQSASSIQHLASNPEPIRIEMIALSSIQPSETNPRTNFDEGKLQELAESIRLKGVLQPILVRSIPDPTMQKPPQFELIAGERRWRASKIAGLATIPAIIREIDDRTALEIQVIENLQRSDLSPAEEAFGYQALVRDHGYTPDELAEKVGKSKSYIYGRLKLCNLPPKAMEALVKGDLPATIGELIGRLPSEKMREDFWADNYTHTEHEWFEWPTYRDIKMEIERGYMRELKGAPFSQADKKLVDGVGSCKDCPKRTGNNRGDYPEGRADICTDPGCFDLKVFAAREKEVKKLEKSGAKILRGDEAMNALKWNNDEYVRLDEECGEWRDQQLDKLDEVEDDDHDYTIEEKTYRDLIGDKVETIVAVDSTGKHHALAKAADARQVLKEQHGIETAPVTRSVYGGGEDWRERQKREAEAKKCRTKALDEILEVVFLKAEGLPDVERPHALYTLAQYLIQADYEAAKRVARRRGLDATKQHPSEALKETIDEMDELQLFALLFELSVSRALAGWVNWNDRKEHLLTSFFEIDPQEFEKRIAKESKKSKKAKAA